MFFVFFISIFMMKSITIFAEVLPSTMGTESPDGSWTQSSNIEQAKEVEEDDFDDLYGEEVEINDPLEGLNRVFHGFNRLVDGLFLRPIASLYDITVANPIKKGLRNVVNNIYAPLSAINYVLQGNPEDAGKTIMRFLSNTTVGLGGILEPSKKMGFHTENTGFGDTLGVWGGTPGFYLELPVFGPSSLRDTIGMVADYFIDPFRIFSLHKRKRLRHKRRFNYYLIKTIDVTDKRFSLIKILDNLEENSLDFYTALKSSYSQRREGQIKRFRRNIPNDRRVS
jgi:phospholipid-binding lipoprotein MlaA